MNIKFRNFFFSFSIMILNYTVVLNSSDTSSSTTAISISDDSGDTNNAESDKTSPTDSELIRYYKDLDLIKASERDEPNTANPSIEEKIIIGHLNYTPRPAPIDTIEPDRILTIDSQPAISNAIDIPTKKEILEDSPDDSNSPETPPLRLNPSFKHTNLHEDSPDDSSPELTTFKHNSLNLDLKRTSKTIPPIVKVPLGTIPRPFYKGAPSPESSSESSSLGEKIAERSTQFFIVPNILIYSFLTQIHKIVTLKNNDQKDKKERYRQLQEEFIWRTVNKTENFGGIKYSLDTFIRDSISVNDLYQEHREIFLTNENPDFIKPFLTNGLSLEFQNELFQAVFDVNSPAYLNHVLARTLIIHGYTLELLEYYRSHQENRKDKNIIIWPVQDLWKNNINNLTLISHQLRLFNPCIQEDGIGSKLKEAIKDKIMCLVRYYNIEMNMRHRACLLEFKRKDEAKKIFQMPFRDLSAPTYNSMTNKTLAKYDKIHS